MNIRNYLVSICLVILSLPVVADEKQEELERVRALDQRCVEERRAALKPVQQQKIAECVAAGKDPGYCQRFYKDYGWGTVAGGGRRTERFFDDLPVCLEAFEARKAIKK